MIRETIAATGGALAIAGGLGVTSAYSVAPFVDPSSLVAVVSTSALGLLIGAGSFFAATSGVALVMVATVGALAVPDAAWAQSSDNAAERLYLHYCSSCHGQKGKGDGPVASFLAKKPKDLTQFTKEGEGTFPFGDVVRAIDGRRTERAHGTSAMPVWGEVFGMDPSAPLSETLAGAGKIFLITSHIESLQE